MKPSRAMIPAELSWAYIAMVFAWSGSGLWPFDSSYLHRVLDKSDSDTIWTLIIMLPAVGLMIASSREFCAHRWPGHFGKNWNIIMLDQSARIRGRFCFALAFSWLYVIYSVLTKLQHGHTVLAISFGGLFFMLFSWIENRRVQRDIQKQTGTFSAPLAG